MRVYENLKKLSENREPQRAYYMPNGFVMLNGEWNFKFYEADFEEAYIEKEWGKIDVPSCWQTRGYDCLDNPEWPCANPDFHDAFMN